MAFCDSCAYELNNSGTPPPDPFIGAIFQVVKGAQSPIYSTATLLFSTIVAVVEVRSAGNKYRKSIFVSFRSGRLRMTTHWPQHIYREDVLRWAWWLHIILVVVWGMECDRRWLGGFLAQSSVGKSKPRKSRQALQRPRRVEAFSRAGRLYA